MMIVPRQIIKVNWHALNKEHFEEKGYVFTKFRDTFDALVEDLKQGQNIKVLVTCDYCNKEKLSSYSKANKKENHYCDAKCMTKHKQNKGIIPPTTHPYKCDYCSTQMNVENYRYKRLVSGEYTNLFCSKKCTVKWNSENFKKDRKKASQERFFLNCNVCGDTFDVPSNRKDKAKYCSQRCREKGKSTSKAVQCDCCSKEIYKIKSILDNNKNVFCSYECSQIYKTKVTTEIRNCEYCENAYTTKKISNQRFCSIPCQSRWQSITLVGEKANNFNKNVPLVDRVVHCKWCTKETLTSPYKLESIANDGKFHFCSTNCRQEWYAKEWSQTDEWKQKSRERAVRNLTEGKISTTNSQAQNEANLILEELNINYINEYDCSVVAIDNYLPDHNLMIEVMGTYWHVDPRKYSTIGYQMQYDRVIHDKRKRGLIKSKYGINILYLWESDILTNKSLCKRLIELYISNEGSLVDYDSFNYTETHEGLLFTNQFTSFMNIELEQLHSLFVPVNSEKRSKKQIEKWVTFNCEFCGEETEQLKSRYIKNKHHHCSKNCKNKKRII